MKTDLHGWFIQWFYTVICINLFALKNRITPTENKNETKRSYDLHIL
jgi:hypothetical protein